MRLASAFLLAALPAASFAAAPLFTLQSQDFTDNAFLSKSFAGNNKKQPRLYRRQRLARAELV
ncbi:hypothetical protein OJE16_01370 [Pantoea tagorei]